MAIRRRHFIVDRSFQLKYTALIAIIGGVISLVFAGWMYNAAVTSTELLDLGEIAGGELLMGEMESQMAFLPWLYLGVTLLMMAALGLLGVLITHRVAGPAFVMGRYLDVVAEGAYPSLRPLRKRDELKGFFDTFERAIVTLRDRDSKEAEALEEVIEKLAASGAQAEQLDVLRRIRDRKRESVAGAVVAAAGEEEDKGQEGDIEAKAG